MIPRIDPRIEPTQSLTNSSWQKQLANAISDPIELFEILDLPSEYLKAAQSAAKLFPLKVTLSYLEKIEKGNIHDPLLRQILPLEEEHLEAVNYSIDPVGDISATMVPSLLHKYNARVLLMPTSVCAIHCRYCFRRHYPYADSKPSNNWQQAIDYIKEDSSIQEVILSGGDPLSLSNSKLFRLLDLLEAIPHVQRIRFHTRYPLILSDRINEALSNHLLQLRCKVIMVLHTNHPNELNKVTEESIKLLNNKNITLLNQSVLLKGVNDNVDTLQQLSERLFNCNVLPYYLHQLDKVKGAQHFAISDKTALSLVYNLQNQISGYLVPKLVRENCGEPSKTPLTLG